MYEEKQRLNPTVPSTSGTPDELLRINNMRNISQRVISLRGCRLKNAPNMQLSLISKEYSPINMIIPSYKRERERFQLSLSYIYQWMTVEKGKGVEPST